MSRSVELIWIIKMNYTIGWGVRAHTHDHFQIYYCLSGSGNVILNGTEHHLAAGDCILMCPGEEHELKTFSDETQHFQVIDAEFRILDQKLMHRILDMPSVMHISQNTFKDHLRIAANEWLSGATFSCESATSIFEHAIFCYVQARDEKHSNLPFFRKVENTMANLDGLEKEIVNYCEEHYLDYISLDDLADHLKYSKNHLCKVFKNSLGITIFDFLNMLKIRHAYESLLFTNENISNIAYSCGFHSVHYFSRAFKKYTGFSPSEIRAYDGHLLDERIKQNGSYKYLFYSRR